MKIYSEKTNKEYATVEDCLAAEKEYDDAIASSYSFSAARHSSTLAYSFPILLIIFIVNSYLYK